MKKVNLNKKLQLKKETIARLNNDQLNKLQGGTRDTETVTCQTYENCQKSICGMCQPITYDNCPSATCPTKAC